MVARKLYKEQKSWSLTLASTNFARTAGWIAWHRKKLASQNALLDGSRVLNSKCPEHFAWEGGKNKRVLLPK
jgi:hypothetical protein